MHLILNISSSGRRLDLSGQCIKIHEQGFAEFMHIIRHINGGFIITMKRLIPIKPKFMSPRLQLGRYAMLGSHFINPFFNFPRLDIWRECFQAKLHCLPIHTACGIEVTGSTRACRLLKCSANSIRNRSRGLFWRLFRVYRNLFKWALDTQQVSMESCRASRAGYIVLFTQQRNYRHIAGTAGCTNDGFPSAKKFEWQSTVVSGSKLQTARRSVQSWPRAARRIGVERGPLLFRAALRFGAVRWCDCTESMPVLGMGEVRLNGVRAKCAPGFMGERFISHRQYSTCYDSANYHWRQNGLVR